MPFLATMIEEDTQGIERKGVVAILPVLPLSSFVRGAHQRLKRATTSRIKSDRGGRFR